MTDGLIRQIFAQHRPARAGSRAPLEEGTVPDHLLLDGASGRVALAAFTSLEGMAPRVLTVVCPSEPDGARIGSLAEFGASAEVARRVGCHVAPPGRNECDAVYRERLAAPGKLAFAAGEGAPSAGAFGTLAFSVDALEAAYAMSGAPLVLEEPRVAAARFEGGLAAGVSGTDVVLALARRLGAREAGAHLEITGRGVSTLRLPDRIAIAGQAGLLGVRAVLFPSDERTRLGLAAERREADWKPLEAADDADYDSVVTLDLDTIEPLMAAEEDLAGARPVRHAMGMPVARVVIGSRVTLDDLVRLAGFLSGRRVHDGTELVIVPGSRRLLHAAEVGGLLQVFEAAGAKVNAAGLPPDVGASSDAVGAGLCTASGGEHRAGRRTRWYVAGLESCAAAAIAGSVFDPRQLEPRARDANAEAVLETARLLEPIVDTRLEVTPETSRAWTGRELEGPLRGAVLLEVRDRTTAADVLPLGARQDQLLNDWAALAAYVFAPLAPDFAARARRAGGGFVTAGHEFGAGEPAELAAIALAALGVRAVLARSFAPGFARRLLHAGVLAVEFRQDSDARAIEAGDELELPGLPGVLEPGKPLTVRNLTRGAQHTVRHRLEAREIALMRDGGLLAAARARSAQLA